MMKHFKNWKVWAVVLFGVVVFGFSLRLFRLSSLPVFVDEAIYVRWSQIMANEATLRFLPLSDGKQPLFMWILMLTIKKFSDPLIAGRLVSVMAGLVTTVGIFSLSYYLFKSKLASVLAAFFWAISPFALFFDRLALVDSLLTALTVWTVLLGVITAKTRRLDAALLTGLALGLAALTKSPALFVALLLPAAWLLTNIPRKRQELLLHFGKLGGLMLVSWAIAFAMYNILRLGPNFHLLGMRNYDYVYPYGHIFTDVLNPLMGHSGGIWTYLVLLAPFGLVLLLMLSVLFNFKNYKKETTLLLILAFLPLLVIAEYSKVVTARYILFAFPYFVILASSAFAAGPRSILGPLGPKVLYACLALFVGQSLFVDYQILTNVEAASLPQGERSGYLEEWTAGHGIKEVSEYIKAEHAKDPSKRIVVGTEGYFGTLPDGLQLYLEGVPNVITIGVGLGISEVPQSLAESKAGGNKTYLVINKSRLTGMPEAMGLTLIAEYPKALRKVGSIEYTRDGPNEVLYFFEIK